MTIPSEVGTASFFGDTAGGTSETLSHDSGTSGSNRTIAVGVVYEHNTDTDVSGVTYNGASMDFRKKQVNNDSSASREDSQLFTLEAPATGANDVVVTFTGTTGTDIAIYAQTYQDVDQSTTVGNVNGDSQQVNPNGSDVTYSFTTGTDNSVIINMCGMDTSNAGTLSEAASHALVIAGNVPNDESSNAGFTGAMTSRDVATAATVDAGFFGPANLTRDWVIASIELLEAAAAVTVEIVPPQPMRIVRHSGQFI